MPLEFPIHFNAEVPHSSPHFEPATPSAPPLAGEQSPQRSGLVGGEAPQTGPANAGGTDSAVVAPPVEKPTIQQVHNADRSTLGKMRKVLEKGQKRGKEKLSAADLADPEKVLANVMKYHTDQYTKASETFSREAENLVSKQRNTLVDIDALGRDAKKLDAVKSELKRLSRFDKAEPLAADSDLAAHRERLNTLHEAEVGEQTMMASLFEKLATIRRTPAEALWTRLNGPMNHGMSGLNAVFLVLSVPSMFSMLAQMMPAHKSDSPQYESPPLNPVSLKPRSVVNAQAQQNAALNQNGSMPPSGGAMRNPYGNSMNQAFTGAPAAYAAPQNSQYGGMY